MPSRRGGNVARAGRFAAVGFAVAATFGAAIYGLVWVGDHDAETYGNRLLGAPRPDECRLARAIVRDFARQRSATFRRAAGAGDQPLEMLAYAWSSDGARAPPGADWRRCPGFGPYVRSLGLARMGMGRWWGPALFISLIQSADPGRGARAWVTFSPPQAVDPRFTGWRRTGATTWRVVFPPPSQPSAPVEWIEVRTTALFPAETGTQAFYRRARAFRKKPARPRCRGGERRKEDQRE